MWALFLPLTPPARLQGEAPRALAQLGFSGRSFILSHPSLGSPPISVTCLHVGPPGQAGKEVVSGLYPGAKYLERVEVRGEDDPLLRAWPPGCQDVCPWRQVGVGRH